MHTEKKNIYVYVYTHVHLCAFLGYCSINECFSLNLAGEDKNLDPLFKFLEDIYIYIYTFKLYMPYTWTSFGASELLIRIYSELVLYWVEVA